MGLFEHFPYANFHELNMDWLLRMVRGIPKKVDGDSWSRLAFPGGLEIAVKHVDVDPTTLEWSGYPIYSVDPFEEYDYVWMSHTTTAAKVAAPFSGTEGKLVLAIPEKSGIWPRGGFIETGLEQGKIELWFDAISAVTSTTIPVTVIAIAW